MAKSITQNGITFSNYNDSEFLPFTRTVRLGINEGLDEDNFGIVNAADIAWNGAQVEDNVTLNSTGDLLNWIKTKGGNGGGTTPTPDPQNPDEPTDSSPSIETLTEEEFERRLKCQITGAECLEEGILYIIVNESGTIIKMYQIIDDEGHYTYMPEPSQQKETGTITLDNFNNLTDSEKASKNWIITDENGNKIGIALEGVLLLDATIEEAEVDGVGYKVMIVDSYPPEEVLSDILYLVKDNDGKITTSYLNGNEIELEKVNGLQKSDVTEMFKKDFVKDNEGNIIGLKHTGISIDKNGDGEIIESAEFNSYLNDYTNKAGFISNADGGTAFAELFATSSTNDKLKASKIIAAINKNPQGGETSSVTISADKIDVDGIFDVKVVGDTDKTASQLLLTADELSSRVSNIENNGVYVSNINQDDNTIDLNVKYTDGNSQAQNASLTLGVDANDSSKIVITADQIKLKGNTFADTIFSGFITADTIDANQIKTGLSEAGYIVVSAGGEDVTVLSDDGIYFDQNTNLIDSLKTDGVWRNWSTTVKNLLGKTASVRPNGCYFYPSGTAEYSGGYGIDMHSTGTTSWIHASGENGTIYINDGAITVSSKTKVGHPELGETAYNWNYFLTTDAENYISMSDWSILGKHTIQANDSSDGNKHIKTVNINPGNSSIRIDDWNQHDQSYVKSIEITDSRLTIEDTNVDGESYLLSIRPYGMYVSKKVSGQYDEAFNIDVRTGNNFIKGDLYVDGSISASNIQYSGVEVGTITGTDDILKLMASDGQTSAQILVDDISNGIKIKNADVYIDADKSIQFGDSSNKVTIRTKNYTTYDQDTHNRGVEFANWDGDAFRFIMRSNAVYFSQDSDTFIFDGDVEVTGLVDQEYNLSDRNLKNVGSDITLTAEQVANAPAVNFTWKDDENNINHVGSIAQYWQAVMPEVVKENKKGNLGLNYSTAALMSAITVAKEVVELKSKVQSLEEENTELKLRLAKIEEKLGL